MSYFKNEYINKCLVKYGISLKDLYDCEKENEDFIENAKEIFYLQTERDFEFFYVLTKLLSDDENEAEEIRSYLAYEQNRFTLLNEPYPKDDEQLKSDILLMLTAWTFNEAFFALSWNWALIVRNEIAKQKGKPEQNSITNARIIFQSKLEWEEEYKAAASDGFQQFGKEHPIPNIGKIGMEVGESGTAVIFYIKLDESANDIVFDADIYFATKADGKEYAAKISKKANTKIPKSRKLLSGEISGIDFADKLVVTKIIITRPEAN